METKTVMEMDEQDGQYWYRPIDAPRSVAWRPVFMQSTGRRSMRRAIQEVRDMGYAVTRRNSGF